MKNALNSSDASRVYADAYAAHHILKELPLALDLYTSVVRTHPNTIEASFAEAQMEGIARSVVPRNRMFAAHVRLARAHLRMPPEPERSVHPDLLVASLAAAFPKVMPD